MDQVSEQVANVHDAAFNGDRAALRRALASGVSPSAPDWNGDSPLHHLCDRGRRGGSTNVWGDVACVRVLLDAGADIHAQDRTGNQNTPLHIAADCGHAKVVAALIKAGADVNRVDACNVTPLHRACSRDSSRDDSRVEPALLLLRNGAAVNVRDDDGDTPLDFAIANPRGRRFVPILLRAGATLPAESDDAYLRKVIAASGFGRYKRTHLDALVATFAPKFAHRSLPPEMVRRVVEYAFHAGHY